MKLTGILNEKVDEVETKEEKKAIIADAGMEISDDELEDVSGGGLFTNYNNQPIRNYNHWYKRRVNDCESLQSIASSTGINERTILEYNKKKGINLCSIFNSKGKLRVDAVPREMYIPY